MARMRQLESSAPSSVGDGLIPFTTTGRSVEADTTGLVAEPTRMEGGMRVKPLCEQCGERDSKYTCPQCSLRTCSLDCCRRHKEEKECAGIRPEWQRIDTPDAFNHAQSIEDQSFMALVKRRMETNRPANASEHESGSTGSREEADSALSAKSSSLALHLNADWRALVEAAERRRIELSCPQNDPLAANRSRYEVHAETIFWTMRVKFVEPATTTDQAAVMAQHEYTVHNIPESLSVRHLLKQFLEPREGGYVISVEEVDGERMGPFREAGLDQLVVFLPAPGEMDGRQFYYPPLEMNKTLLENLRRKRIHNGHPIISVAIRGAFPFDSFPITDRHSAYLNRPNKRPADSNPHQRAVDTRERPPMMRGRPFPAPHRGGRHEWGSQPQRLVHQGGNRPHLNQGGSGGFGMRPWQSHNDNHRPNVRTMPHHRGGHSGGGHHGHAPTRFARFQHPQRPQFHPNHPVGHHSRPPPRFANHPNRTPYVGHRRGSPSKIPIAPRELDPYERFIDRDPASIDPAEYVQHSSGGENSSKRGCEKAQTAHGDKGTSHEKGQVDTPVANGSMTAPTAAKKNYLEMLGEEYDSS